MAKPKVQPRVLELEDRTTPAGNVTAFVGGGVLNILGDEASNLIKVDRLGRQSVMIRSMDSSTTINGQSTPQWFGDIANGFDIKMGGGDDLVQVSLVDTRWLDVDLGAGSDSLEVISSRITRRTTLLGGAGDDDIRVFNTTLQRRTTIDAGDGDDRVSMEKNRIEKRAFVEGGGGINSIVLFQTSFPGGSPITNFGTTSTTLGPRAITDEGTVQQNKSVTINVAANDEGNGSTLNPGSVTITSNPTNGTLQNNGNGTITYTSNGASGGDSFTYTIANLRGTVSNRAIVSVNVTPDPNASDNPSVTLTSTEVSPTLAASIAMTAVFNEPVTGFTLSDIVVANGTASGFTTVNNRTYTFNVAPTADGDVTVTIPAGSVTDTTGKPSLVGNFSIKSLRTDAGMVDTAPSATDVNFVQDSNGIGVWDTVVGTGATVATGANVRVFYSGWLTNGTLFDSSRTAGSPTSFDLDNLIQGWQLALPGMRVGGIRRLLIPPSLGYGSNASGSIPPNSTLIFEIKMMATS
jgi:hypothetical protein